MRKNVFTAVYTMIAALAWSACTAIGPHPAMLAVNSEIKASRIQKIVVIPTLGTGTDDPDEAVNRIVPAGAFQRYGEIIVLSPALGATVSTLGMPDNSGPPLAAAWQVLFYKWVKGGNTTKQNARLEVPEKTMRVAETDLQIKKLSRLLRKRKDEIDKLGQALSRNDPINLEVAADENPKGLAAEEQLFRHLTRRLKVSHLLASWIDGDEDRYKAGRPIVLHVALINIRSGMVRWYAKSQGRKGDIPANYEGFLGVMVKNMFEDIEEVDGLER